MGECRKRKERWTKKKMRRKKIRGNEKVSNGEKR
jgi:hypothetical protein